MYKLLLLKSAVLWDRWTPCGQSRGTILSAQLNVECWIQAGKLVFSLSCVDHKDERSIDRYVIDIFMVSVGEWRLCMLARCYYWDIEFRLLYHSVIHLHCDDSRVLWNSLKNGSPPSLLSLSNMIMSVSLFRSLSLSFSVSLTLQPYKLPLIITDTQTLSSLNLAGFIHSGSYV